MTARSCWFLLLAPLLIGLLPSPAWSHALPDEKLILAMEYHYPAGGMLTFVFRNQWDHPVTILSPRHPQAWQKQIQVLLPDGRPISPVMNTDVKSPGKSDYMQIPPKKTLRILVVVPAYFNLSPGQLYFLKLSIPTNRPARSFFGVFPYGMPTAPFVPWNGGDQEHRLRLSMQCSDRFMRTFSLMMENFTLKKAIVLPPDFLQPIIFHGPDGKNLPMVSNYLPSPNVRDQYPIQPAAWVHFHIDIEKCCGTKPLPGRLYFLDFRYPTNNDIGTFTGVFPYGIPVPLNKQSE